MQSGLYFDFFFKKLSEIYIRNIFIYTSQFFGEKYIIEYLTKKLIDVQIFNSAKWVGLTELNFTYFFIQIISSIIYFIVCFNLYIIIY